MALFDLALSVAVTAVVLAGFRWLLGRRTSWTAFYRLFLLLFMTGWAVALWIRPYAPSTGLVVVSVVLLLLLLAAGFVPRRPPRNRAETKALLDQVETDRALAGFFDSQAGQVFWPILGLLVLAVVLRLVSIF